MTNEIEARNESQNLPLQNGRKRTKCEPRKPTRKSTRERNSLDRLTYLNTTCSALNAESFVDNVPANFEEAKSRSDFEFWQEAINEEKS